MTSFLRPSFAAYPNLRDASVIVTGGASGIGMEIVRAFAGQSSRVGFLDFDVEHGDRLAAELQAGGGQVRFEPCDLRDTDALRRAATALAEAHGPARVLVNNAARDDRHRWEDVTPEFYDERIATNLRHMFFAIQAVAPGMIAAGGGSIINLGSDSRRRRISRLHDSQGRRAWPHARHGPRPRAAPDPRQHAGPRLDDDRTAAAPVGHAERPTAQLAAQCLPDSIEPIYVARMALFLASDDSAMCTANNYMVEAGSI